MRRSLIVLTVISMLLPGKAWAIGAFVTGCANGGPLATPMGVSAAATSAASSVSATVVEVGRAVKMEQKKIIASIDKNFETQNSLLRQLLASLGISMEKMTNMRMYGPQSKAYCIGTVKGRLHDVMAGRQAEEKLARHFRDSVNLHTRRFKNLHERSIYYSQKEASSVSPSFFFPGDATLSAEQINKALFAIRAAVDPFPSPRLPEEYEEEGRERGYEAGRKAKYSRLVMPTAVISDIVASYAPVMDLGDWAGKMYEKMGGSNAPPQVVDGKISPMSYIDLMVDARFANQQWYSGENGIHAMTDTGVLRELAVMESVSMEMQRRQMRYLQQTAGLLAQDQAMETGRRFNATLDEIYRKVAAQK